MRFLASVIPGRRSEIERLYRRRWRYDLLCRLLELAVFLGAWALLIWALASAFGP